MGGAFVALADDATAAFSNPAGLMQFTDPEISIEGRYWSYTTPFTAGGRVSGDPIGLPIDTTDGLIRRESSEDELGLSFLSFVYPQPRWSLAFYRHTSIQFRSTTETNGLFGDFAAGPFAFERVPDQRTSLEIELVSHGLSGAFEVSDTLFLGAGVSYYQGDTTATLDSYKYCSPLLGCALDQDNILGPNPFDPQDLIFRNRFAMDDHDWSFNVGFLWLFADDWVLGGTFRRGPEFDFNAVSGAGPGLEEIGIPEGSIAPASTGVGSVRFPDVLGLGVAVSPSDALRISFEWDRVEYSSVLDTTVLVLTGEQSQPFNDGLLVVEDADEFRLGFEYTLIHLDPILSLRVGAWRDPDHRPRYVGELPLDAAFFPGGDDEMHYSAGIGVVVKKFQVDLGVDLSDQVNTVSLSALARF